MCIVFFTSSIADTGLALATANHLKDVNLPLFFIPLSKAAFEHLPDKSNELFIKINLMDLTDNPNILSQDRITESELAKIQLFLNEQNAYLIYLGIPSHHQETSLQIAHALENRPFLIVSDFMFKLPQDHIFLNYSSTLLKKMNVHLAVPTLKSKEDFINWGAKPDDTYIIGHLSIDKALSISGPKDTLFSKQVREMLAIQEDQEFIFASGSTQPLSVDEAFIEALLKELAEGDYPNHQIRLGIHPGVQNLDKYLHMIFNICEKFPGVDSRFKVILTSTLEKKLKQVDLKDSPYILRRDVKGPIAAQAADKIAQGVPGTLLIEGAILGEIIKKKNIQGNFVEHIQGKAVYTHDKSATAYLPDGWVLSGKEILPTFFKAPSPCPRPLKELQDALPIEEGKKGSTSEKLSQAVLKIASPYLVNNDKKNGEEKLPSQIQKLTEIENKVKNQI